MSRLLRRRYGAGPWHLAAMAGCFLVAGYAATRVLGDPALLRIGLWFVGAAVAWDLGGGPLLALADRVLRRLARPVRGVSPLNFVRVPALMSASLLLVSAPLVLQRAPQAFEGRTGTSTQVYLGRWAAVTAVLLGVAAVLFLLAVLRRRGEPAGR